MVSFLFEQYGYYPNLINNTFFIDGWEFRLIEIEGDESYIDEIDAYTKNIREMYFGSGAHVVKTRFNKKISFYDNKKFVLISVYSKNLSLNDLNKMHVLCEERNKKVNLNELRELWEGRMSVSEKEGVASLRVDSSYYSSNLEVTMFGFGMCQNAIQYLSEIIEDYGNSVDGLTVVHKRLKNLNSFDFYNPFNLVVDHPVRDFVELYRNNFLSFREFVDLVEFYKIDNKLASLFIARLMYPVEILDLLEENIQERDKNFKLNYSIEKEMSKLKKAYVYFKQKYNIRPIQWLEAN